ncbi:response regulator [Poseidonibacter lekithochrous]|uniref:response regulator n=1 Tax=Poseidonibacter lekithochrous TaxID=1904463 RepID=UPI0013DD17F1|nr:response regulator [Poseidonibacter lekithochrous]
MLNENFFKTLTILYVENDLELKTEFSSILNKFFKKVFIANDAKEALIIFNQCNKDNITIDVIVSESQFDDFSGLDLLTKIRTFDKNLPFIFFTESNDIDLLLESLRQDVTAYFMKPLNLDEVLKKVQEVCLTKKQEDEITDSQNEVEDYLNIINKVAVVFIFDVEGNIVYINDFLRELVKCEDEDIIGFNYRIIFHPDMATSILDEQWRVLQSKEKWQGKSKYITKSGAAFFSNCTIIPVLDEETQELRKFISVNFLTTKEESEKREYKKKVLFNLQETKRVNKVAQQKIDELEHMLERYKGYENVVEYFNKQKVSNIEQYSELQKLENKLKAGRRRFEQLTFGVNDKINKISILTADMRDSEEKASKKIVKVSEEIKIREAYILKIKDEIKEKSLKIKDLEDVVKHRTEQLVEKKG